MWGGEVSCHLAGMIGALRGVAKQDVVVLFVQTAQQRLQRLSLQRPHHPTPVTTSYFYHRFNWPRKTTTMRFLSKRELIRMKLCYVLNPQTKWVLYLRLQYWGIVKKTKVCSSVHEVRFYTKALRQFNYCLRKMGWKANDKSFLQMQVLLFGTCLHQHIITCCIISIIFFYLMKVYCTYKCTVYCTFCF